MTPPYVTWLRDTTHPYVTWLFHMWHDWFICYMTHLHVTWRIYVCHDSFICACLIHMRHDSCIYDKNHLSLTWTNSCLTTHPYVHPYSFFYPRQKTQWPRAKKCSSSAVPIYTSAHIYLSLSLLFWRRYGRHPPWKRPTMNLIAKEPYCPSNEPNFLYVWNDLFVRVAWCIHVRHGPFIRMRWLSHM